MAKRRVVISNDIDVKRTAAKVEAFLDKYPDIKEQARPDQIQAVHYEDMPRGQRQPEAAEKRMLRILDAREFMLNCDEAVYYIRNLIGDREAKVIELSCFRQIPAAAVMSILNFGNRTTYTNTRRVVLTAFAYYWPVRDQQLLVAK